MILFLWSCLLPFLWANPVCESQLHINPSYEQLNEKIDIKVRQASNLVTIAKEADSVLSKLLTHKSPILVNWINKRKLMDEKEEVIAGQWRYYYLNHFILSKYPTTNEKVNTSVETLFKDINKLAFPDSEKKKIESTFARAKRDVLAFVPSLQLGEPGQKEILARLSAVNLYWFKGLKSTRYEKKPLEFLKWGPAYDPIPNQINLGIEVRKYPAEALYSVFIHEMGHSIDPCRWSAFLKSENPFQKLYQCLRKPDTANAQPRNDEALDTFVQKKYLSAEAALSLKENPFCNRTQYPPVGTQKEQLVEVFADWFAAEVIAANDITLAKIRPDLCDEDELQRGSSYLSHQDRLQRIYFVQPKIREKLKLSSKYKYCPVSGAP